MGDSYSIPRFKFTFFHKRWSGWLEGRASRNLLWIRADLTEVYGGALLASRLNPSLPSWSASCEVLRHPVTRRNEKLCGDCNLALNRSPVSGDTSRQSLLWRRPVSPPQGSSSQGGDRASREHQIEVSRVQHTQYVSHWAVGLARSLIINIWKSAAGQLHGSLAWHLKIWIFLLLPTGQAYRVLVSGYTINACEEAMANVTSVIIDCSWDGTRSSRDNKHILGKKWKKYSYYSHYLVLLLILYFFNHLGSKFYKKQNSSKILSLYTVSLPIGHFLFCLDKADRCVRTTAHTFNQ